MLRNNHQTHSEIVGTQVILDMYYVFNSRINSRTTVFISNICLFFFFFLVKRCIDHIPVHSQQIQCSQGTIWGSTCTFTCSPGYCLQGSQQLTCATYAGVDPGRPLAESGKGYGTGSSGNGVENRSKNTKVQWDSSQPTCESKFTSEPRIFMSTSQEPLN